MAQCLYPITIGQKDGPKKWKVVPCGKCIACRRRRQAAWSFRLLHEMQHSSSAAFLTLTYDDQNLPWADEHPSLCKRDFQLFMKRLRKKHAKESTQKLVYYACGEYGSQTYRPHYHAIMFNLLPHFMLDEPLAEIWDNGHVRVDDCNIKTIQYVTKYVMKSIPKTKAHEFHKELEFSLMSKGIGKSFLTKNMVKYYKENEIPYLVWKDGQKITMPRYFKEKIYDEETLRRFGREALREITPQNLDTTKQHEIYLENLKLKRLNDEKRSKV